MDNGLVGHSDGGGSPSCCLSPARSTAVQRNAAFLEPTAPTVPAAATDNEQHDYNDQKCRGVHVLSSCGCTLPESRIHLDPNFSAPK
jgi:hypothetical protein